MAAATLAALVVFVATPLLTLLTFFAYQAVRARRRALGQVEALDPPTRVELQGWVDSAVEEATLSLHARIDALEAEVERLRTELPAFDAGLHDGGQRAHTSRAGRRRVHG